MRNYWVLGPLILLTACDLSPDLSLPQIAVPEMFKETEQPITIEATPGSQPPAVVAPASDGKWRRTDDKAQIEEFAWWRMFNDEALNHLQEQAMHDNPSLDVAAARLARARATAASAESDLEPSISAGAGPTLQRISPGGVRPSNFAYTKAYTTYNVQGTISYELDLFGKKRNLARNATLKAESEKNNFLAARLSLQADIAQTYFQLAALRMENEILTRSIETRQKNLELTRKKRDVGAVDDAVLSAAEIDLSNVQSDLSQVSQQQSVAEHALAILIGQTPTEFKANEAKLTNLPPLVPAGLPSTLLERRPDIQAAIHTIAAANATIGVARSGYFPDIALSVNGGFTSGDLSELFNWSNRSWMIGPLAGTMLTQPIYEGGRIAAVIAQSNADYASAVASYRGAVLQAFREVEDNLSSLRNLGDQTKSAAQAVKSSTRSYDVAAMRHKLGAASYLEQLDAERAMLASARTYVQVLGNRYITTVQLVKALGGSWQKPPQSAEDEVPAQAPAASTDAASVAIQAPSAEVPMTNGVNAAPDDKDYFDSLWDAMPEIPANDSLLP
jgi:multidrug efflux system outer membrane protein